MISPGAFTILAVDDSSDDLLLLRQAFRKHGAGRNLREVGSAQQALAYLEGRGEFADRNAYPFPSVMLVDIKMPAMSGLELLERMAEMHLVETPQVLVLSTSSRPSDIHRAEELGALYLPKPVSYSDFMRFAGEVLSRFAPVGVAR